MDYSLLSGLLVAASKPQAIYNVVLTIVNLRPHPSPLPQEREQEVRELVTQYLRIFYLRDYIPFPRTR